MLTSSLQIRPISAKDALRTAVLALQRATIETASLDARLLLQHVLNVTREYLLADNKLALNPEQHACYMELIEKRIRHQPVSQLIERREFWGLSLRVTQDTLDPRPDSETLIEAVLARVRDREAPLKLLDMGTGTGCLLLALLSEYPNAYGTAVDISPDALNVAKVNTVRAGFQERVTFIESCWGEKVQGEYDIIISNPPYIPTQSIALLAPEVCHFEPLLALDGGADGLDCYRIILSQLPRLLAKEGMAVLEIGLGQQRGVEAIAMSNGLQLAGVKDDLAGIPRCILLKHQNG